MVDTSELKNINSIQEKFTSDKVKYNNARAAEALTKLKAAVKLIDDTIPSDLDRITAKESMWKGKSKTEYEELKSFYMRFRKDFNKSVTAYRDVADGADYLLNHVSEAKVLKEVSDA